jgi:hypothetical protein
VASAHTKQPRGGLKMISDVLTETVQDIDEYLKRKDSLYQGGFREVITELRNRIEAVRIHLETPVSLMSEKDAESTIKQWKTKCPKGLSRELLAVYQRLYGPTETSSM